MFCIIKLEFRSSEKTGYFLAWIETPFAWSSQACYPLHHQDSPCRQHNELTRCIWIAVSQPRYQFGNRNMYWKKNCFITKFKLHESPRHSHLQLSDSWLSGICGHYSKTRIKEQVFGGVQADFVLYIGCFLQNQSGNVLPVFLKLFLQIKYSAACTLSTDEMNV